MCHTTEKEKCTPNKENDTFEINICIYGYSKKGWQHLSHLFVFQAL